MKFIKGDALKVFQDSMWSEEHTTLLHQVNCQRVMGSGIALQIRKKYPIHFSDYLNSEQNLGNCVTTSLSEQSKIVGVFGQQYYGSNKVRYTNYLVLIQGIVQVCLNHEHLYDEHLDIIIPSKLGCDRGGGDWDLVLELLKDAEYLYPFVTFIIVEYQKGN